MLAEVREAAAGVPDVFVLSLPSGSELEINTLQRAPMLVLQKSTREGFGFTVTEAMWKCKPVVAGCRRSIAGRAAARSRNGSARRGWRQTTSGSTAGSRERD